MRGWKVFSIIIALAPAAQALAEGFTPRAIISWQAFESGFTATSGLHQEYDLNLDRTVSDPLSFRLHLRAEDFRGDSEVGSVTTSSKSQRLQPTGEVIYSLTNFQMLARYDGNRTDSESGSLENSLRLDRFSGSLQWRPEGLPGLFIETDNRKNRDDVSGLDLNEDYLAATLDYEWKGLRAAVTERTYSTDDEGSGFTRDTRDDQLLLDYDQTFFNGRLTAYATALAAQSEIEETSSADGAVLIPVQVPIIRALHAVDDTPLDSRDHPPTPVPALTDRNVSSPTFISVGPESTSYQTIVFDLGRIADVDEVRIFIRDGAGNPLRTGGGLRWDAFVSDDGVDWIPMRGGARTAFDLPRSLYSVSFGLISTRWLKIVSFGVNIDPSFITEVEAYYHTELPEGQAQRTTDRSFYSGMTTLTAQPLRWLGLTYYGLFNSNDQSASDGSELSTEDTDQMGSVQVDPSRFVSMTVRYQTRNSDSTNTVSQGFEGWTGLLDLKPTRLMKLTLEADRQQEDFENRPVDTTRYALHAWGRVFPTLEVNFDAGTQTQEFALSSLTISSNFFSGRLWAQLTRSLDLRLDAFMEKRTFDGMIGAEIPVLTAEDKRSSAELYWRPGQQFALGARIGWVDTAGVSAITQRYLIDWNPFWQGSVSISARYDQDIDPYADRTSSRIIISPRWTMNRHAMFDLNYTKVETTGQQASAQETFYATLTLKK